MLIGYNLNSYFIYIAGVFKSIPPSQSSIFQVETTMVRKTTAHLLYIFKVPSCKHTKNYGKIHHFSWVNPLFRLGHFTVRFSYVYQRVDSSSEYHSAKTYLWRLLDTWLNHPVPSSSRWTSTVRMWLIIVITIVITIITIIISSSNDNINHNNNSNDNYN